MKTKLEAGLERMDSWMVMKHRDHKTRKQYRREVLRYAEWKRAYPQYLALEIEKILEHYLTARAKADCAASTQNVAFHALRCFYERGMGVALKDINALRATRPKTIRRAPSLDEVWAILPLVPNLYGYPCQLICEWLYGEGLRVSEPLNARLKDIDWEHSKFTVRDGKHGVSRVVAIPCSLMPRLRAQAEIARLVHLQDKANGVPVPLPGLLAKKYPRAPFNFAWAFLFPAKEPCVFEGQRMRWHVHESAIQRAFKAGVKSAGASEDLSPHHLRHAWATHTMRRPGVNVRDVQIAMGHKQLETTAGYITPEIERIPDALAAFHAALSKVVPFARPVVFEQAV